MIFKGIMESLIYNKIFSIKIFFNFIGKCSKKLSVLYFIKYYNIYTIFTYIIFHNITFFNKFNNKLLIYIILK